MIVLLLSRAGAGTFCAVTSGGKRLAADEEVGTSAFDDVREKVGHATFVVTRHFTELELFDSSLLLSRFCTHSRNAPACEALIKREQSRSISAMEPGRIFFLF